MGRKLLLRAVVKTSDRCWDAQSNGYVCHVLEPYKHLISTIFSWNPKTNLFIKLLQLQDTKNNNWYKLVLIVLSKF